MDPERKARLAALRAEAAAAGDLGGDAAEQQAAEGGQQQQQDAGEPTLRFRNYAPVGEERIQHEKVRAERDGACCGRLLWHRHAAMLCPSSCPVGRPADQMLCHE